MKFVAVSSCPTGIAHTYMAAEALEQAGRAAGHDVQVETQGAAGSTPLDPQVIADADGVIFAADLEVKDRERFAGKPVVVRSQLIEAVAYALLWFAPNLGWVVFARLLLGLTFGNVAVMIATQTLLTPNRHMAAAMATVQASIVGVTEMLTLTAQVHAAEGGRPELFAPLYGFALLCFFVYCYPIDRLTARLERRFETR